MDEETIAALRVNGSQMIADGERGRLEFQTDDGPVSVMFPRTEVMRLISFIAQLNLQPEVSSDGFTSVEAFPTTFFQLSSVESGDLLLSLEARDGASFAFLMEKARAARLHEALGQALEALGPD